MNSTCRDEGTMKAPLLLALAFLLASPALAQQQGDASRGQMLYEQRCTACHSLDANRVGPAHRGVYGRQSGVAEGFTYTPALESLNVTWDDAALDRWLANPTAMAPGTAMGFTVPDPQDRADIIAYLRSDAAY
jgi:cytochrome c